MKLKKAPGFDLITSEVLRNMPQNCFVYLTTLINKCFNLRHVPIYWKFAEITMIPKPGKSPNQITSYRPISLLPVMSKLFEKLLLSRLMPIIERKNLIPIHQFGFRKKHSTIDQIHRVVNTIENTLEEKKVCSAVFLDVSQAFDKVWHAGLLKKLKIMLPAEYCRLLSSYLDDRYFSVKYENAYSSLRKINAGVPQGSILGPLLYLLYTHDLPSTNQYVTATFADDTALLAVDNSIENATTKLQEAVNNVVFWAKKWRIKLNESKSTHIIFSLKRNTYIPIYINASKIPYVDEAKYLGITLDAKLRWKAHVKKKRAELDLKLDKLRYLIGRRSSLSIHNKLLIYKHILRPVWTYGIQFWGCACEKYLALIQRFQNKTIRIIANAPYYVRNSDLHRDLGVPTVTEVSKKFAMAHKQRLQNHVNVTASSLLQPIAFRRRLRRKTVADLMEIE